MKAAISDEEFIRLFKEIGATKLASKLKQTPRTVFNRRKRLERLHGEVKSPIPAPVTRVFVDHPARVRMEVTDGVVLVGSDGHYWPGPPSTAHRAFVKFCRELKPKAIVVNGDSFDGSTVSRHARIGWENTPTVFDELGAVKERHREIEDAAPAKARLIWPLGNHDARFETRLASVAPEYAKVHGFHLKDHFGPRWEPCWSLWINDSVVIKHRWKSGVHGVHQNTVSAGVTMITGHDHALRVSPYTDYNNTRWGVSDGTLAEPYGPQFIDYTEDNPRSHRSGFIVLTFRRGELLWPETVSVHDQNHVDFRGGLIPV